MKNINVTREIRVAKHVIVYTNETYLFEHEGNQPKYAKYTMKDGKRSLELDGCTYEETVFDNIYKYKQKDSNNEIQLLKSSHGDMYSGMYIVLYDSYYKDCYVSSCILRKENLELSLKTTINNIKQMVFSVYGKMIVNIAAFNLGKYNQDLVISNLLK